MASPADIKEIFLAASDRPTVERGAFLDNVCAGDAVLRQRIEALLKAHDATGGWLGDRGTPTSDYPGFAAPSTAELAPHFPQLEILELLGQGGMGAVYKARQKNLDRLVALKILPHDAGDRGFAERFTREARTLAKLNHPGIVAVHDFGATGGLYWFVMEFVDGVNLRQAKRAGTLTPTAALAVVPQICEALQFAHDAGVVHRDIKPENVLIDAKGRVKIADFGLAKLTDRPDRSHLTGTHQAMGTPHYMAPEQWERPLEVDHRADIYSLGVVFYELLTGELPLGRFPLPSQRVQIDVRLDEVVLRTLEKEPARRYQHASEVKTDVERISSTDVPTPAVPVFGPIQPAKGATEKTGPSRWWPIWILIALIVIGPIMISAVNGPEPERRFIVTGGLVFTGIATLSLLAVLTRRAAQRRGQSVVRFCRLERATTQVIFVCSLGVANALVPWWVIQWWGKFDCRWFTGISTHFGYRPVVVNCLFLALGLFTLMTSEYNRIRPWRAIVTLLVAFAALMSSLLFIEWILSLDVPRELRRLLPDIWISVGPFVAAGLSVMLMVIAALDLRGWLTSKADGSVAPVEILRPVAAAALRKDGEQQLQQASELKTDVERIGLAGKTPEPAPVPDRPLPPRQISLWWMVIAPTLLLTMLAFGAAMYVLVGQSHGMSSESETKAAIVAANVALIVFATLLIVWFIRRKPLSVARPRNDLPLPASLAKPSFFWRVVVPSAFLALPLIFLAMVWAGLPQGTSLVSWLPIGAIGLLVVGFLWLWFRWRALLGRPSAIQMLARLTHDCRLNSPMTWAIIVCVMGIANSFSPWLSVTHVHVLNAATRQSYGQMSGWRSAPNDLFDYCGLVANSVFPALGLTLLVISANERWRSWRALATLLAGTVALFFSIVYTRSVVIFNSPIYWYGGEAAWGPYVAATLAGLLLVIGALDLRGWLSGRGSRA